jgi:transcriptional antiterminator NusG
MVEAERRWYVIHTYSGYEQRVQTNLEQRIRSMDAKDKIFSVTIPTENEIEIKDGQKKTVARKVFPGYILVEMQLTDESWNVVRNTPGVTGFVGAGSKPVPLEETEVKNIFQRMKGDTPRIKVGFHKSESVRVIDGPFIDLIGVVDEINSEKGKVRVLISLFGRETPVELDFLQIERL